MSERGLGVIKDMRSSEDEAVWTGLSGKYPDGESDRAARGFMEDGADTQTEAL
jgi:hypothetical protein